MHHYGLIYGFAGCWKLEPVCWSRCLTWPLTQLLSAKIWADPRVVFMAKMPFGQYTRQTLFCIITPCMLVILAKKVQGKGSKVCIVMSERNKYGLRVQLSTWRMVQSIVTKFLGRPGRGMGSRIEGCHFIKLWYEWGISLWNDKLLCETRL